MWFEIHKICISQKLLIAKGLLSDKNPKTNAYAVNTITF